MLKTILVLALITSVSSNRIIGGQNAIDGEYPYHVSLRDSEGVHFCGGTIITSRTILTSYNCLMGRQAVTVVVGSNSLSSGTKYQAQTLIKHPNFSPQLLVNDLGLIILEEPIIFTVKVQPISLQYDSIGGGVNVTLTGWGYPKYPENTMPDLLQAIDLKTITVPECQSELGVGLVYETTLCTAGTPGKGTCHGDYGSPLVANDKLVGVVSWLTLPCGSGKPDVYSRISRYTNWIDSNKV